MKCPQRPREFREPLGASWSFLNMYISVVTRNTTMHKQHSPTPKALAQAEREAKPLSLVVWVITTPHQLASRCVCAWMRVRG